MRFPRAGQTVDAYLLSADRTGRVDLVLTPADIEDFLGTRAFTLVPKFLYTIPLYFIVPDKTSKADVPTVVSDGVLCVGPVLICGRDETVRSLSEFELNAIADSMELEKIDGTMRLILHNISRDPVEWRGTI